MIAATRNPLSRHARDLATQFALQDYLPGAGFFHDPARPAIVRSRHHGEYLALILLATIGLMLLVGSEELLMIFIGLELTGLSLYVMTAFDQSDLRSAEAGLKYFLFGSMASAFTLFGLSFIYGITGRPHLPRSRRSYGPARPTTARCRYRHDAHRFRFQNRRCTLPSLGAGCLSGCARSDARHSSLRARRLRRLLCSEKLSSSVLPLHGSAAWHAMVAGWSPASRIAGRSLDPDLGNLVALAQTNVRRLLAYSAVAHAGYTLLGLVAGGRDGFSATLFYTTIYAFTLVGAFGVVALVRRETGGDDFSEFCWAARRARHCSQAAWRSSCFPWPACRRWLDFSEISISLVQRCARVIITVPLAGRARAAWQFHLSLLLPRLFLKAIFVDELPPKPQRSSLISCNERR